MVAVTAAVAVVVSVVVVVAVVTMVVLLRGICYSVCVVCHCFQNIDKQQGNMEKKE